MDSIEIVLDGKTHELTPSFGFIKRLKKTLGTGSLIQIQMAASSLDMTVVADILDAALKSNGVSKYTSDSIGDLLMTNGGIQCIVDGEDVGGMGAAIRMITMTLTAFTRESKDVASEKN